MFISSRAACNTFVLLCWCPFLCFTRLASVVAVDETSLMQTHQASIRARGQVQSRRSECAEFCLYYLRQYAASPRGLAYVHIPKNAGTTIEAALGIEDIEDGARVGAHCPASAYESCNYDEMSLTLFTSLRNPFDRAVSSYFHLYNRTEMDQADMDFNAYVSWLQTFDIHDIGLKGSFPYTPQWDCIIGKDGTSLVRHFVRVESLSQDWKTLQNVYLGLPDLPEEQLNARGVSQLEDEPVIPKHPTFCFYYNNRSLATAISRLYAVDFAFTSYDSDIDRYCGKVH